MGRCSNRSPLGQLQVDLHGHFPDIQTVYSIMTMHIVPLSPSTTILHSSDGIDAITYMCIELYSNLGLLQGKASVSFSPVNIKVLFLTFCQQKSARTTSTMYTESIRVQYYIPQKGDVKIYLSQQELSG